MWHDLLSKLHLSAWARSRRHHGQVPQPPRQKEDGIDGKSSGRRDSWSLPVPVRKTETVGVADGLKVEYKRKEESTMKSQPHRSHRVPFVVVPPPLSSLLCQEGKPHALRTLTVGWGSEEHRATARRGRGPCSGQLCLGIGRAEQQTPFAGSLARRAAPPAREAGITERRQSIGLGVLLLVLL